LDTVSRQIFGDIQGTQFSGSKMQAHVHLKNAFQGEIGNRRIRFGYNLWFAPPAPYESCKIFEGPSKMPFQNWYTANTNHFRMTDFCQLEINNTTVEE